MTPTQPRTKAGKGLFEAGRMPGVPEGVWRVMNGNPTTVAQSILAIEEEAVSEYREALRGLVEWYDSSSPGTKRRISIKGRMDKARSLLQADQVAPAEPER